MNAFFADTFYWIAFTNVQDLAEVLTNDVHFEQEGFRAVLRESRQAG